MQNASAKTLTASFLASLRQKRRKDFLASLTPTALEILTYDWEFWARPEQRVPLSDWHTWVILAGRGPGKRGAVRSGCADAFADPLRWAGALTGALRLWRRRRRMRATWSSRVRRGCLTIHPADFRPKFERSKRRLIWPNGAVALLYNATEPDQLRGPQHDAAWCDELAKWHYARETWDMLQFGLRLGEQPRQVITTTPRPIPLIREFVAREGQGVAVTRGSTYDNRANLAAGFFKSIVKRYEGTRLGRQELNAEVLDDIPGALWTRAMLDDTRVRPSALSRMQRIVIGVDPAAKPSAGGDRTSETGIVVAGLGEDGRGYVLDDLSCRLSPAGWARKVAAAFDKYSADAIVVEINQGGAMVETVMRAERPGLPLRPVRASRGKTARAEPIAALYEQGRVSHAGAFLALEDQMVQFTPFGIEGDGPADRADALVWALSDLFPRMVKPQADADWSDERGGRSTKGGWLVG